MNAGTVMRTALRALVRNKVRSFLTALGIIVGIAAVIAVVSVGQGATVQVRAQINSMGEKELVAFENGLVVSKTLVNGDMVRYRDYILVNGVPLATEIIMDSHDGGRFRIRITEPEVNGYCRMLLQLLRAVQFIIRTVY